MDDLLFKFQSHLNGEIPASSFSLDELLELQLRTMNVIAYKKLQENNFTFEDHRTIQ